MKTDNNPSHTGFRTTFVALSLGFLALGLDGCAAKPSKPSLHANSETAAIICVGENAKPAIECAHNPAAVFDTKGRLITAWEQAGKVYVSHSSDLGKTFSKPVAANPSPEPIVGGGVARPKIALSKIGAIYVAWTRGPDRPEAGEVRFSRSLDGGQTFTAPLTVSSGTAQSIAVNDRDYVYLSWISGQSASASLYFAFSSNGGRSFHVEKKITDPVCADCGPAMTIEGKKFPVILWKQASGHALTHFTAKDQPGPARTVSEDASGHSPALAVGPEGEYFAAWSSGGIYFSASMDHGKTFLPPAKTSQATGAGQPELLADGPMLHLAWTESDGQKTVLREQHSLDAGQSWSPATLLAETSGEAGQPVLLAYQGRHFVAWQSRQSGFKLISVD